MNLAQTSSPHRVDDKDSFETVVVFILTYFESNATV